MASQQEPTGWIGWIGFASFMLMLGGVFSVIAGLVALFNNETVYSSLTNSVWVLDYTTWGWVHVVLGFALVVASGSLLRGGLYGRVFAVVIALLSAVANMAFIPVYPIWSLLVITVDILVIYAITVHGKEIKHLD